MDSTAQGGGGRWGQTNRESTTEVLERGPGREKSRGERGGGTEERRGMEERGGRRKEKRRKEKKEMHPKGVRG